MHNTPGPIERGVALKAALDSIAYLANNLSRWSCKADASTPFMRDSYIELLQEDYAKLGKKMEQLRQAMAPAPAQDVSHETKEIAA